LSGARSIVRGRWAGLLLPVSWVYGAIAARRRARARKKAARLLVPVLSVGNITCGGTGKTPVVEMLVRRLLEKGLRPAILSRGYRAGPDGSNDEARVLAANLPGVPHLQRADRVAAGREAIAAGADVLVLDDGFQHQRLARDLDLVLIDALDPFGGGRVLPAGLLREPLAALGEATLIGITRAPLVPPALRGILRGLLRDRFPGIPRVEIEMDPVDLSPLAGGDPLPPEALRGIAVLAFAGLGNPEAFRRELERRGARIAAWLPFPDHHPYRPADLERVAAAAGRAGAEAIVTTQKDAVKLTPPSAGAVPWLVLRIAGRAAAGAEELEAALELALGRPGQTPREAPRAAGRAVAGGAR
jgi:tetraacyldisaccharide 4'-kinase